MHFDSSPAHPSPKSASPVESSATIRDDTLWRPERAGRLPARLWSRAAGLITNPNRKKRLAETLDRFATKLGLAADASEVRSAIIETLRDAADPASVELLDPDARPADCLSHDLPLRLLGDHIGTVRIHMSRRAFQRLDLDTLIEPLLPLAATALLAIQKAPRCAPNDRERRRRRVVLDLPRAGGTDPATGLPDHDFLHAVLLRALCGPELVPLALILVEPVGLTQVRANQGPVFADSALGLVARAVVGTLRASDPVVRLDQNRLAAVLPGAAPQDARRIAGALARAIREAGQTASTPRPLTAHIGVASAPDDTADPRQLIRRAETPYIYDNVIM